MTTKSVLFWLALSWPAFAAAQFYRINPQPVTACGGFSGNSCFTAVLEGELEVDADPSAPRILYSDIVYSTTGAVWPAPGLIDLSELPGQLVGDGALRFSTVTTYQSVELTIESSAGGPAVLNGHYGEGCCDRYGFLFEDLVLEPVALLERRRLNLLRRIFTIEAEWSPDPTSDLRFGHAGRSSDRWGHFWFFSKENPELIVKILDVCPPPSAYSHWVFVSGMTNLEVVLRVRDNVGRRSTTYQSNPGQPFAPILDTSTFFEHCPRTGPPP